MNMTERYPRYPLEHGGPNLLPLMLGAFSTNFHGVFQSLKAPKRYPGSEPFAFWELLWRSLVFWQ
jgi:hypothetical protein